MSRIVDGATQILGIVGDPVRQVRSPAVWSALFRANGINAICIPMQVSAAEFDTFLAGLRTIRNLMGLIVTIPHKPAAARRIDRLTDRAAQVGSVNVVRRDPDDRWTGDIVDGVGFVRGLARSGQRIEGRRALIVGAGGVGAAIAFAVAEAKAASVHVFDIIADRAAELVRRLEEAGTPSGIAPPVAEGFDLLVNASPLGMKPDDPLPIDAAGLASDALAADAVIAPQITPWLAAAQERGCHVQPGTVMMENQLIAMGEFLGLPGADYSPEAVARALRS